MRRDIHTKIKINSKLFIESIIKITIARHEILHIRAALDTIHAFTYALINIIQLLYTFFLPRLKLKLIPDK